MLLGAACVMLLVAGARGGDWRWPDGAGAASVRIDTKVRFIDDEHRGPNKVQADEIKQPVETEGFYNRPAAGAGSGRYPVQSEPSSQRLANQRSQYSDGTLDSVQYCKCVTSAVSSCHSRASSEKTCPTGQNLCCYKRTNRNPHGSDLGIFSELEDERPMLLPNRERSPGPFSDPEEMTHELIGSVKPASLTGYQTGSGYHGLLFGPGGPTGVIGPRRENGALVGQSGPTGYSGPRLNPGVLVGPDGPSGVIGPNNRDNRYPGPNQRVPLLVGPDGPTGIIGPNRGDMVRPNQRNPGVLVGPDGPTGVIGPNEEENIVHHESNKYSQGVLVGPAGPTGSIGPGHRDDRDFLPPASYVRPNRRNPGILVGPDGPTGQIGVPNGDPWVLIGPGGPVGSAGPDQRKQGVQSNQGAESAQVLVGPGGPTGSIGPGGRRGRWETGPGVLVGPGGPTGVIGPGQRILVGPGGPTGRLGPPRGYGYSF